MKEFTLIEYNTNLTKTIIAETLSEAEKIAIEDGHRRSLTDYRESFGLFTTSEIMILYHDYVVSVVDYLSDNIMRQNGIIERNCPELVESDNIV